METDINQLGWISHYSPIVHDGEGNVSVRPEYYGMLAFSIAGKGDLIKLNLDKKNINLSAYATIQDKGKYIWITVINKDTLNNAAVELALPAGYSQVAALWLKAPAVTSETHVTLAGTEVSRDGTWTSGSPENVKVRNNAANLKVPPASALLLRLSKKTIKQQP